MKSNWTRRKFIQNASLGLSAGMIGVPSLSAQTIDSTGSISPHDVKIGSVSISGVSADNPEQMVQKVLGFMNEMAAYRPDIICLPEGFAYANLNNYTYDVKKESEAAPQKIISPFQEFAVRHRCYIICPTYTAHGNHSYISAVLIDRNGKIAGEYNKMRPTDGEMASGVTPGKMDPPVFDTDFGRIGIQICFDIKFEEGWNILKQKGAQIVFWPSAYAAGVEIASRAWKHQVYVVSSTQKDTSKICDLTGEPLAQTSRWQPNWVCAPVNMEKTLIMAWPTVTMIPDIQKKYGSKLTVRTYGEEEWLIMESFDKDLKIADVMRAFSLKPVHAQLTELNALHAKARTQEKPVATK